MTEPNVSAFVADLLRGDYEQSEYGKMILPFTVLRRFDCVLKATEPAVLAEKALREKVGPPRPLAEIDVDLELVTDRIVAMSRGLSQ